MAQIVVVAVSPQGWNVTKLLRQAGHDVICAGSAPEAIDLLSKYAPELLVAELRLGAFNGLYLVIRHQLSHPKMSAIILDRAYDPVLAGDAHYHGADYVVDPIDGPEFLARVERKLAEGHPQRRWPRKRPTVTLLAQVAEQPARVVDLSYGGVRLEAPQAGDLPDRFHIVFPGFGLAIQARPVWTHPAPSGSWWCGAEVSEASPVAQEEWRHLVDSLHAVS